MFSAERFSLFHSRDFTFHFLERKFSAFAEIFAGLVDDLPKIRIEA